MDTLQIILTERESSVTMGGDMTAIAREIGKLAIEHDEFALALNLTMIHVNNELNSIRLRDEMIGMINN